MTFKSENIIIVFFICGVALLTNCKKAPVYPLVPVIAFDSLSLTTLDEHELVTLYVSFTDGDGDLGVLEGDTTTNVYPVDITGTGDYANIQANIFMQDIRSGYEILHVYSLPYLTPNSNQKAIKGQIEIDMKDLVCRGDKVRDGYVQDTIFPKLYIVDRAENQSNTIDLPAIIINCD